MFIAALFIIGKNPNVHQLMRCPSTWENNVTFPWSMTANGYSFFLEWRKCSKINCSDDCTTLEYKRNH